MSNFWNFAPFLLLETTLKMTDFFLKCGNLTEFVW